MKASKKSDRQTFLARLWHSGLVPKAELARVLPLLPNTRRAAATAQALMDLGVLTPFQAERLLAGRGAGLRLGQYRILEPIGSGGMGLVFKAEHRTMQRIVALKMLNSELLDSERAVGLFLHEVRAVSRLVHPNIVTAYDANEVNGRYYLVLEYVDGPDLDQLVRAQGPLPVGLACDYARQVALGLQCAHGLGMVHRDIKPANILVPLHGPDGEGSPGLVKISDFGLARLHPPAPAHPFQSPPGTILTLTDAVMGTPDYLSPEQARCLHETDIRSDLYSLGCTLHFLLTGAPPFDGGSAVEKLLRHGTERPAPLTAARADVPPPVAGIVDKLLAKRPEERFQTPAELAEALAPHAVSGPPPWPQAPRPQAPAVGPGPRGGDENPEALREASSSPPAPLAGTTAIYQPAVSSALVPATVQPRPSPRLCRPCLRASLLAALAFIVGAVGACLTTIIPQAALRPRGGRTCEASCTGPCG